MIRRGEQYLPTPTHVACLTGLSDKEQQGKSKASSSLLNHKPGCAAAAAAHASHVRSMFYSTDLLSPKGALGQIWVRAPTALASQAPRVAVLVGHLFV